MRKLLTLRKYGQLNWCFCAKPRLTLSIWMAGFHRGKWIGYRCVKPSCSIQIKSYLALRRKATKEVFISLTDYAPYGVFFFFKDGSYITWEHFVTTKYNFGAWAMFCCKQEEAVTSKSLTSAGCWHLQMSAFGRLLPTSLLLTSQCCSPVNYWHIVLRLSRGFYRHFSYGHSFEHQIRWLVYNLDFWQMLVSSHYSHCTVHLSSVSLGSEKKIPLKTCPFSTSLIKLNWLLWHFSSKKMV